MKMKKLLSIALSLALSLGLLAGCGGGGSQSSGSQATSGSLETAQPASTGAWSATIWTVRSSAKWPTAM